MSSIRLKIPRRWYERIQKVAEEQDQTPEQLLLCLVSMAVPPPKDDLRKYRLAEHEALLNRVDTLCRALDATRGGLVAALNGLARERRHRPEVAARRRTSVACLRAAMKMKGLKQIQLAEYLGVSRSAIADIVTGRASLPPAWLEPLNKLFGRDWLMPP